LSDCGGVSEGHSKTRSIRSCCPGRRCTFSRTAAGGTLNNTPATVIGIAGASSAVGVLGQVGHNRYDTAVAAAATRMTRSKNGKVRTRRACGRSCVKRCALRRASARGSPRELRTASIVMRAGIPDANQRAVSHGDLSLACIGTCLQGLPEAAGAAAGVVAGVAASGGAAADAGFGDAATCAEICAASVAAIFACAAALKWMWSH
jgi:hypothetical protein